MRLVLLMLLLVNMFFIREANSQTLEIQRKEFVMPPKGSNLATTLVGIIDQYLYVIWSSQTTANAYWLSKSSIETGELTFFEKIKGGKDGKTNFFLLDKKVVMMVEDPASTGIKINYTVANETGVFSELKVLASASGQKSEKANTVKYYPKKDNSGLTILVYNHDELNKKSGKYVSIFDISKDLKVTSRTHTIEITDEFYLPDLKIDDNGNVNGIIYPVKSGPVYFVSFRKEDKNVVLFKLEPGSMKVYAAGQESRNGKTAITGFCGEESNLLGTLSSFLYVLEGSSGKPEIEQMYKVEDKFIAEMLRDMGKKNLFVAFRVAGVNFYSNGDISMVTLWNIKTPKEGDYKNQAFIVNFDKDGSLVSFQLPPLIKTYFWFVDLQKGAGEDSWLFYDSGGIKTGTKDDRFTSIVRITRSGLEQSRINGIGQEEFLISSNPEFIITDDGNMVVTCVNCFKKNKFGIYILSSN